MKKYITIWLLFICSSLGVLADDLITVTGNIRDEFGEPV